jgi:trk system potassium uptake protein TrkH
MSGPFVKGIAPRIKETISRLWKIYLFLTLLLFVLILLSVPNMSVLEAACLTFTTISTGGMDIKTGGVGSFNSVFLEWILIVFMMVGSINFSLYYHIAKGNLQRLRNPEFLLFLCGTLIFAFILSFILYGAVFQNLAGTNVVIGFTEALRYGIFHAVSSITTTGYSIANYVLWPWTAQIMMFVLTFVGGMVGSTTGGLKVLRHFVLFKTAFFRLYLFFKPDSVRTLKIDEMEMNQNFIQDILVLFWTVIIVGVISVFVFVSDGINPHSSMGIVSSMLTNSGLAFHVGGYVDSVVFLSPFLKVFSSFLMLLGRLEYFILLILFIPSFWRSA